MVELPFIIPIPPWPGGPATPGAIQLPFRVEYGELSTPEARVYRVPFAKPFPTKPVVVCSGGARAGELVPPKYVPPAVEVKAAPVPAVTVPAVTLPSSPVPAIPTVTVPAVPAIELPEVGVPRLEIACSVCKGAHKESHGTWYGWIHPHRFYIDYFKGIPPARVRTEDRTPADWPRKALYCPKCGGLRAYGGVFPDKMGEAVGYAIHYHINLVQECRWPLDGYFRSAGMGFGASMEKALGQMNENFTKIIDGVMRGFSDTAGKVKTGIERTVGDVRSKVEGAFSDFTSKVKTAVDAGLGDARAKMDKALGEFKTRLDGSFKTLTDSVNTSLGGLRSSTSVALSKVSDSASDAIGRGIAAIYQMEGVRRGVLTAPVAIKTITQSYFELEGVKNGYYEYLVVGPT